jgi:hypothetical protein
VTPTTDALPVPRPSPFHRRIERKPPRPRKWRTVEEWSTPTVEDYEARPDGTRLTITAGGSLRLTMLRRGERWTVLCRTEVPSRALAGASCAPRVPNIEGQEAGA